MDHSRLTAIALDAAALQIGHGRGDVAAVERLEFMPERVDAAANLASSISGHVGLGIVHMDREGALARRLADGQHIRMAGIAEQTDGRGLVLHQRVGGHRRAVHDDVVAAQEIPQCQTVVLGGAARARS